MKVLEIVVSALYFYVTLVTSTVIKRRKEDNEALKREFEKTLLKAADGVYGMLNSGTPRSLYMEDISDLLHSVTSSIVKRYGHESSKKSAALRSVLEHLAFLVAEASQTKILSENEEALAFTPAAIKPMELSPNAFEGRDDSTSKPHAVTKQQEISLIKMSDSTDAPDSDISYHIAKTSEDPLKMKYPKPTSAIKKLHSDVNFADLQLVSPSPEISTNCPISQKYDDVRFIEELSTHMPSFDDATKLTYSRVTNSIEETSSKDKETEFVKTIANQVASEFGKPLGIPNKSSMDKISRLKTETSDFEFNGGYAIPLTPHIGFTDDKGQEYRITSAVVQKRDTSLASNVTYPAPCLQIEKNSRKVLAFEIPTTSSYLILKKHASGEETTKTMFTAGVELCDVSNYADGAFDVKDDTPNIDASWDQLVNKRQGKDPIEDSIDFKSDLPKKQYVSNLSQNAIFRAVNNKNVNIDRRKKRKRDFTREQYRKKRDVSQDSPSYENFLNNDLPTNDNNYNYDEFPKEYEPAFDSAFNEHETFDLLNKDVSRMKDEKSFEKHTYTALPFTKTLNDFPATTCSQSSEISEQLDEEINMIQPSSSPEDEEGLLLKTSEASVIVVHQMHPNANCSLSTAPSAVVEEVEMITPPAWITLFPEDKKTSCGHEADTSTESFLTSTYIPSDSAPPMAAVALAIAEAAATASTAGSRFEVSTPLPSPAASNAKLGETIEDEIVFRVQNVKSMKDVLGNALKPGPILNNPLPEQDEHYEEYINSLRALLQRVLANIKEISKDEMNDRGCLTLDNDLLEFLKEIVGVPVNSTMPPEYSSNIAGFSTSTDVSTERNNIWNKLREMKEAPLRDMRKFNRKKSPLQRSVSNIWHKRDIVMKNQDDDDAMPQRVAVWVSN